MKTSFAEAAKIWRSELWQDRRSPIEPTSAMAWGGGYNQELMNAQPSFWVIRMAFQETDFPPLIDGVAGILSGHFGGVIENVRTNQPERAYRIRGLWVAAPFRNHGIGTQLIHAAEDQARTEECLLLWTFPRQESFQFYRSVGFTQVGDWVTSGEFGPNCYAIKSI